MNGWIVLEPIRLSMFRTTLPASGGMRIVLLKDGVPKRVLPEDSLELKLSPLDAVKYNSTVGVRKYHTWLVPFTEYLFTRDGVEVSLDIKLFIRSQNSDHAIMHIAVAHDDIYSDVCDILQYVLKYYCKQADFDGLDEYLREVEQSSCDALNTEVSERGHPLEIQRLSVMSASAKNPAVLTPKQAALEQRIAEDRYSLSLGQLEKKFGLEKMEAKSKEELKAVGRQAQAELSERESRVRAELIRTYAAINHQYGENALPVEVRRTSCWLGPACPKTTCNGSGIS